MPQRWGHGWRRGTPRRQPVRARLTGSGAKASYGFYPDRALVHEEFQAIRAAQAAHHPQVTAAQWDRIEAIIFHQRELRPVRPGKCTLFPTEERAPWALPIAQRFRILSELANLRFNRQGETPWGLTAEQHSRLFARLCDKGDLTFKALAKDLIPFKNKRKGVTEVQIIVGYKGLIDLARRSGQIESLSSRVVHERDDFDIDYGTADQIVHKPFLREALVRNGASTATAAFQGTDSTAMALWPKCERSTTGQPLSLSPIAAGLESLLDLPARDRAKLLGDLLKTAPDRDDFVSACTDAGIVEEIAAKVWGDIEAKGWDAKAADIADKGARFKGQWEAVAGTKFGTEKIKTWRPEGWTEDLADASIDDLEAELGEARQDLERAVAAQAVGQAELDRLAAACADIDELKERSTEAQLAATKVTAAYGTAQRERDALPHAAQTAGLTCPCCNAALQLAHHMGSNQHLVKADAISTDELKRRRDAIASADGKVSQLKGEHDAAERAATMAQSAYQDAQKAERQLGRRGRRRPAVPLAMTSPRSAPASPPPSRGTRR